MPPTCSRPSRRGGLSRRRRSAGSICSADRAATHGDARPAPTGSGSPPGDGVSVLDCADTKGLRYLGDPPRRSRGGSVTCSTSSTEWKASNAGIDRRHPATPAPHSTTLPALGISPPDRGVAQRTSRSAIERGDDDTAARLDEVYCNASSTERPRAFGLDGRGTTCIVDHRARPPQRHQSAPHRIPRLAEEVPRRGSVVDRSIHTGTLLRVRPRRADEVEWIVHP